MSTPSYADIRKAVRAHPWVNDVADDMGILPRRVYRAVKGADLHLLRMIHAGKVQERALVLVLLLTHSARDVARMLLVTPQYISQFRSAGISMEKRDTAA